MQKLFVFTKALISNWSKDQISSYSASLAYFSIFALAPLIIICTSLIGLAFGQDIAEKHIIEWIALLMGNDSAKQIHTMIINAKSPAQGIIAQITSFIILLLGASGIFSQIQVGLNEIWEKKIKPKEGFFAFIRNRFFSFALVISVAFLLLVSLLLSTILSFLSQHIESFFSLEMAFSWLINFVFSLLIISFLFALIYKYLPDIKLSWAEVKWGAIAASFLFILGKTALGFYLSTKHFSSAYGPAGSLIVILIWLYYTSQILFIGAEIIKTKKIGYEPPAESADSPNSFARK